MKIEKINKTKQHTVYKNSEGKRVPGVTTVLGILNKPALVKWANNLGLQGIDSSKYVDSMASIGTLAHAMVQSYFENTETDTSENSEKEISLAENCLLSFFEWIKDKKIENSKCETRLVSDIHNFGGTCDIICDLDAELVLIDVKTGKAIYSEYFYQLAGYKILLRENGYDIKKIIVLRIGRDETEGFETRTVIDTKPFEDVFLACLNLYKLINKAKL